MNSIAASERIKVYHGNFTSAKTFSIQQNVSVESEKLNAEEYLGKNPFFKKSRVGFVKFVDDRIIYSLFRSAKFDIDSVYNATQTIAAKMPGYRTQIIDKYDAVKKTVNTLSSSVDAAAIYQNRYFSNMFVITESFDTENDIVKDSSSLFVDTYEQKLTLVPSKIDIIGLTNASVSLTGNGALDSLSSINNLIDASAATYFDYRQSSGQDNVYADISINLSSSQVINQIVIDVNNFGAQLPLILEDILFTEDGTSYSSISNQISFLNKFLTDEHSSSRLILDTMRNNGSSLFTIDFIPVSVKGVQLKFKQNQKHPGYDQYLIGINDISLRRAYFNTSGSVIVKKAIDASQLKSVALEVKSYTNINLSALQTSYQISLDGSSWHDIQPINAAGDKAEILSFNQPWLSSSLGNLLNTGFIYVKIVMNKNIITDDSLSDINTTIRTDERALPTQYLLALKTDHTPIIDSSSLEITSFVGMGIKDHNTINLGKTQSDKFLYSFKLPITLANSMKLTAGDTILPRFINKSTLATGQLLGYWLDQTNSMAHISIPNPTTISNTFDEQWLINEPSAAPTIADKTLFKTLLNSKDIKIFFDTETYTRPSSKKIALGLTTNKIKQDISITKVILNNDDTAKVNEVKDYIAAGATKVQLSFLPIHNDTTKPIAVLGGAMNGVEFKDGFNEFIGEQFAYSIDFATRTLYLSDAIDKKTSISYYAYDSYTLNQNDFNLIIEDDAHYVEIKDSVFSKNAKFYISYIVDFPIPSSLYRITDNVITFTSFDNILFSNLAYSNQTIKISYSYKDTLRYSINEIIDLLTPSINNLSIIYSI